MTDTIAFPPLRDLPPGRLQARKQHLLGEIARAPERARRPSLRLVLVTSVAALSLVGAAVAIAAGFGAFNGISAAQHPQTGADVLGAPTLAFQQQVCGELDRESHYWPQCHLVLDSARFVGKLPSGEQVFVVTNTHGDLCSIIGIGVVGCDGPLSNSHPISVGFSNESPDADTGGTFTVVGIAIDGVTSVSFTVNGNVVTVPVENNFLAYEQPHSHSWEADCIVVHFADGSSVSPFPEVGCPSSAAGGEPATG